MIEINPTSSQPIFEQIIAQIKMAVLKGLLKPGDSIPSVRKMALSLSVTPGTVAKAYGELERQQVIVTIRGKGAYIAETGKIQPSERQKEQRLLPCGRLAVRQRDSDSASRFDRSLHSP